MPKPITFTDEEKRYLVETLDGAYDSYKRRKALANMPGMDTIFQNAMDKTQSLREKITKEA